MKNSILILKGDKPDVVSEASHLVSLLTESSKSAITLVEYSRLVYQISDEGIDIRLPSGGKLTDFDLVYLRDFQGYMYERNACAHVLKLAGKKFVNSDAANFEHISKLTQYAALAGAGVPIPSTIYGAIKEVEELVIEKFGFPFIAKSIIGRNGEDNYLVDTKQTLDNIRETLSSDKFIYQEFIENDHDYRAVVINGKVAEVFERRREVDSSSHVNNATAGGGVSIAEKYPEQLESISVKAAEVLGREVAGLDIMPSLNGERLVVLEVNSNYGVRRGRTSQSRDILALSLYFDSISLE